MKVHSTKTDNYDINSKINLRKEAVKGLDELRVLDLFAGENKLWKNFDKKIYFGVEKEKNKGKNLNADNNRIIKSLDLSRFNVIDLDSYGIPFNQIYDIFNNPTLQSGTVFVFTCITNKMSAVNKKCLKEFNLEKIYKKCKVLVNGKANELFYAYLQKKGIKEVYLYEVNTSFKKQYGYFFYNC